MADEKALAREILGKHYSDVDDVTSSESEEEFKSSTDDWTSSFPVGGYDSDDSAESTDSGQTESDYVLDSSEQHSDNDMQKSNNTKQKEPSVCHPVCHEREGLRTPKEQSNIDHSSSGKVDHNNIGKHHLGSQ